jgi:hypothetical protein
MVCNRAVIATKHAARCTDGMSATMVATAKAQDDDQDRAFRATHVCSLPLCFTETKGPLKGVQLTFDRSIAGDLRGDQRNRERWRLVHRLDHMFMH